MLATLLLTALLTAAPVEAPRQEQAVEEVADPLAPVRDAYTALAEVMSGSDEAAIQDAEQRLAAAIASFAAKPGDVTLDDLMQGVVTLFRAGLFPHCSALAEAGTGVFPEESEPVAYIGLCGLIAAQEAEDAGGLHRHGEVAVRRLLRARELDAENTASKIYLNLALASIGRFEEALAEYDERMEEGTYAEAITTAPKYQRGRYLLGSGKYAEAVRELEHEDVATGTRPVQHLPLQVRALALSGDGERALERARKWWSDDPNESSLALLADTLAYTGDTEAALKLLREAAIDPENELEIKKSRACLELLIGLDGERPDDLRARLTETLDHHLIMMGAGPDGGDLDLVHAPLFGAFMSEQVPWCESSWANDLWYYLCAMDAPSYEPSPIEATLAKQIVDEDFRESFTGPGALKRARGYLQVHIAMNDAACMLTITRLLSE